jgi:hypothetical protein
MNDADDLDCVTSDDSGPALDARDRDIDAVCEAWVVWCRERRLYWPTPAQGSAIARRGGSTRPVRADDRVAIPAASLAALHIAYTCQPNSLDKQVFDLYYVDRVKPIKAAAAALGIGRRHFYRVLIEFRRRLDQAAQAIEGNAISHGFAPLVNTESVPSPGHKTDS